MSPSPGYFQKGIVLDRVIIVGAGMAGIASALSLARRGVQVCVLESARGPLQAASYAPGGYLGPAALHSFVQPLSAFERMRRRIACTNPAKSLRYRMGSGQSDFLSRCLAFCEPNSADLVQSRFSALIGYSRSVLQAVTDEYGLSAEIPVTLTEKDMTARYALYGLGGLIPIASLIGLAVYLRRRDRQ